MYLICELRFSIFGCEEVKDIIPELVEKYIVSEFSSEIMFLKARSVQIFSEYGSLPYN